MRSTRLSRNAERLGFRRFPETVVCVKFKPDDAGAAKDAQLGAKEYLLSCLFSAARREVFFCVAVAFKAARIHYRA